MKKILFQLIEITILLFLAIIMYKSAATFINVNNMSENIYVPSDNNIQMNTEKKQMKQ